MNFHIKILSQCGQKQGNMKVFRSLMEGNDLLEMTQTADDYYGNDLFKMLSKVCNLFIRVFLQCDDEEEAERQRRRGGQSGESNCCRGDVIKDS